MQDPWDALVGRVVLVETVTLYYAGTLVQAGMRELCLQDVCYVADTGRKMQAIASADFAEVEPIQTTEGKEWLPLLISRTAVVTVVPLRREPGPWSQK